MANHPGLYPLFRLLSECRNASSKIEAKHIFEQFNIHLHNGFAYWVRVCTAAFLLTNNELPKPTHLCERFFSWDPMVQYAHLLSGWWQIVTCPDARRRRRTLINHLISDEPAALTELLKKPSYRREMRSIALSGLHPESTNEVSHFTLTRDHFLKSFEIKPWKIENDSTRLVVPLPANWSLLWELEKQIAPQQPYHPDCVEYSLAPDDLVHLDDEKRQSIGKIVTEGLQSPLPPQIRKVLDMPGGVSCQKGYLLSFNHSETLAEFRHQNKFPRAVDNVISPHHIFIEDLDALLSTKFFPALGLHFEPEISGNADDVTFDDKDAVFLSNVLILGWYARVKKLPVQIPDPELKLLIHQLPAKMVTSALQKAEQMGKSEQEYAYDDEENNPENGELIAFLTAAINELEPVQILYKKPGMEEETRPIIPLALERRGMYLYLIAYCQKRNGRRTFRLNRILSCWS